MLAIAIILLYSYLVSVNAGLNPAIPVRSENETLQANDTEDSIEVFESLGYAPDNLPFLDPTLPFVGREGDVRNVTDIIVLNRVSIVGISGSPAFGKSTLAIHIGYEVVKNHITVGYINADEDDLFSEVSEGIGTREMLTMEGLRLYFGRKKDVVNGENPQSMPKRWEELKRWAAGLKVRALLVLDNCDTALEVQGGELFKKVVREIWEAGRGRLQLIITSQKVVAFANINFLPYPIRKLSPEASVKLLKKMVEGVHIEMSDEQAKIIGNLTDGCPLALRIIGTELRSPEMGVSEMIHDLTMEILKIISDHPYPNVSRFQAIMNVAYNRLSAGEQFCAQQISFFPGSFGSDAGVQILGGRPSDNYGELCITVLVYRSLLDRYWIRYGDNMEKRFVLHKLIKKFFMSKYMHANVNSTFLSSWNSFNNTFRNFYSDYVSSYIASERTEWQELKFRAEAHNTQSAIAITIMEQTSVIPSLELSVVYGYYRRMVPMNSMTFQRVYYMFNDQERMCDALTIEVCSAVLADLLYQYYVYECREKRHNCTLFKCEHVIHASNLLSKVRTIPVDNPSVRSFLSLFHGYNYMCNFLFGNRAQPCIFGVLVGVHLLLFIVRRRNLQQVMHALFCILFSACLSLSSFIQYIVPCGLGLLEAFSIVCGHHSNLFILLRLEYVHFCLLLFTLPPLPYLIGYVVFVALLIYMQERIAKSWSGSQATHSQGPDHVIIYSNSEHRLLLLCIYAVTIIGSVNSSITQNHITDFVVTTGLVLLAMCITTVNVFPPVRIFGIKL